MSRPLSDLFFGKIAPFETIIEKTSGTQEQFRQYVCFHDSFEKQLTDEQRKTLDSLITMRLDLETTYAEAAFREGFSVAVRLIADSLAQGPSN